MHEELKELLTLLAGEVGDLKLKLEAIDKLLGAPYAKDFSDEINAAMVDDVLRYTMMLNDIYKFGAGRLYAEIREMAYNQLKETVRDRTQNKDH